MSMLGWLATILYVWAGDLDSFGLRIAASLLAVVAIFQWLWLLGRVEELEKRR